MEITLERFWGELMVAPSRAHFIFGHPLNVPLFLCWPHETFANHGLGRSYGRMELSKEMHLVHMLRLQMSHENTFGKVLCACADLQFDLLAICRRCKGERRVRACMQSPTFCRLDV